MDFFKKFLKDVNKKKLINLITMLVIGIVLLILSSTLIDPNRKKTNLITSDSNISTSEEQNNTSLDSYEEIFEKRLEDALSMVDGVGKVKVMINLTYSSEVVIAQDIVKDESITKETDNEGGSRDITSRKTDIKNIIITENGEQKPLILKELAPKIEGIIIVAEGGDEPQIQQDLIKSAQTILSVDAHKVQVLKMK